MSNAYIGLGSNLGDRRQHIQGAFESLAVIPRTRLRARSGVYQTEPVGPAGQREYLNAAAHLETSLEPLELLECLLSIEDAAGRKRGRRWGPRTLDLDLLLYDDRIIRTDQLRVPHPRMHERWFVLKPLCDIDPAVVHPALDKTVGALLAELETNRPASETR